MLASHGALWTRLIIPDCILTSSFSYAAQAVEAMADAGLKDPRGAARLEATPFEEDLGFAVEGRAAATRCLLMAAA